MDIIARTPKHVGAALRRYRRLNKLTQDQLAARMSVRQGTISKLEAGEPATQMRILTDALAALGLELMIRPRSTSDVKEVEDLF